MSESPKKSPTDRWTFFADEHKDWRWRRTGANGFAAGASAQCFTSRAGCEADARAHGWKG